MNHLKLSHASDLTLYQHELTHLLIEKIKKYTHGESSTLGIDTTQEILQSIQYAMYMLQHLKPEFDFNALSFDEQYRQSQNILNQYIEKTKSLYYLIEIERLPLNNAIYTETFESAIPCFLQQYDPEFGAHETVSEMDYPLIFDTMSEQGILYLNTYLSMFRIENKYCSYFDQSDINHLLHLYYCQYDCDAYFAYLNIFEWVFKNSCLSTIINPQKASLIISPSTAQQIQRLLEGLSLSELKERLEDVLQSLIRQLRIQDLEVIELLNDYCTEMLPSLYNALQNNTMHHFILIQKHSCPSIG